MRVLSLAAAAAAAAAAPTDPIVLTEAYRHVLQHRLRFASPEEAALRNRTFFHNMLRAAELQRASPTRLEPFFGPSPLSHLTAAE
eukprot:gene21209-37201_t